VVRSSSEQQQRWNEDARPVVSRAACQCACVSVRACRVCTPTRMCSCRSCYLACFQGVRAGMRICMRACCTCMPPTLRRKPSQNRGIPTQSDGWQAQAIVSPARDAASCSQLRPCTPVTGSVANCSATNTVSFSLSVESWHRATATRRAPRYNRLWRAHAGREGRAALVRPGEARGRSLRRWVRCGCLSRAVGSPCPRHRPPQLAPAVVRQVLEVGVAAENHSAHTSVS